jgi:hypothetical protein
MFLSQRSKNVNPRRVGPSGAFGLTMVFFAVSVLPTTMATAQVAFCSTVERLNDQDLLRVNLEPTDSYSVAIAKIDRMRTSYSTIQRAGALDIKSTLNRVLSNLARVKVDLVALRRAKPAKAAALRSQIEQRVRLTQIDIDLVELKYQTECAQGSIGTGAGTGDGISDPGDIVIAPTPKPASGATAPTPSSSTTRLPGTGVFVVGVDTLTGPYTTAGSATCSAGQSDDPTGTDITAGFTADIGSGVTTIMLDGTRKYFITRGCPGWTAGVKP